MGEINVKDRQTLLDIALSSSGSLESIFDLATSNDISVTAELKDGDTLNSTGVLNTNCVDKYNKEGISPATELTSEDLRCMATEGIGFMCIGDGSPQENCFVIS